MARKEPLQSKRVFIIPSNTNMLAGPNSINDSAVKQHRQETAVFV